MGARYYDMKLARSVFFAALIGAVLAGVALTPVLAQSNGARAQSSGARDGDWPMYNRDLAGTRYSPLSDINTGNVGGLKRAWSYRLRNDAERARKRGNIGTFSEATPIVVNGVMYVTAGNRVLAIEPETGKELWRYQVAIGEVSQRGVSYWPGDAESEPRILFTSRSQLIALNAKTGRLAPGFGKEGVVDMTVSYDAPPTIFKNIAFVGATVGEDPQGDPGDSRAYDVRTGKKLWDFHSVPQPGETGHETWQGESWKNRSGVNVWGFSLTVDEERGILYMPFGGPAANFYGGDRKGDNLFGNSLVAVDAETGKLKWHFQAIHHDIWDWDLPPAPGLVDIVKDGQRIPALAQVSKSGWMFILDRVTGKPVFGVEEREVPKSDVPGEESWPTQPFPVKPAELSKHSYSADDLVTADDTTPEHAQACRELVEKSGGMYNAGPYTPYMYRAAGAPVKTTVTFPGSIGSTNWGGTATDPTLGYVFVNSMESGSIGWIDERPGNKLFPYDKNSVYGRGPGARFEAIVEDSEGRVDRDKTWPCQKPPWGHLTAVNANTGEFAWRVVLGVTDDLPEGKKNTGRLGLGGPIVTAGGLVFIGATNDRRFRAFDSKTGKQLWETKLDYNAMSIPMTFLGKDGKQYVAVVEGGGIDVGGGDDNNNESLVVFALP
jgi:quinoprotein glucose dehydrogenase